MPTPRLCVTLTAPTMAELRAKRDQVLGADLVELRLDTVSDPDAAGAVAGRTQPVIVTCRAAWEGGYFRGSEEERLRLLDEALALGAEYVDVEWRADSARLFARTGGARIILSVHDFGGVPVDLLAQATAMKATGAAVVKIAVTAHRLQDALALLPLASTPDAAMVLVAMGEAGLPSRLLSTRFGSAWTYAGESVAPGQVPLRRMRDEFGAQRVGPSTAIYGIVGRPVGHSVSPAMHNAAFRAAGIDAIYLPLAAADFADFLVFADALGIAGASVTAPFKVDAFAHAAVGDALSRRIGSINTLRREGGAWAGCNTDVAGFLAPLTAAISLKGSRATVMGAGGAARAAAIALASEGARVSISARRGEQAAAIAAFTGSTTAAWPPAAGSWDVLVNATPVGTHPDIDRSPLPAAALAGGALVYDLIYNPTTTRLQAAAAGARCKTLGGLDMLVAQAQAQFEWWTGVRIADRVMRDAASRRLEEMRGEL